MLHTIILHPLSILKLVYLSCKLAFLGHSSFVNIFMLYISGAVKEVLHVSMVTESVATVCWVT